MPVTLVLGSATEVASTYPARVTSTHRAAEMTCAHHPKMTPAHPAAEVATTAATTKGKAGGRNASAAHRYGGNHDRDSVQHKLTFPRARVAKRPADDECFPRRGSTADLFCLRDLIIQQGKRLLDRIITARRGGLVRDASVGDQVARHSTARGTAASS